MFLLVTFAERLTEVEDDSDFLDLIKLSSFTCVPLHVELQSSHCLPNPFSFPWIQWSFKLSKLMRTKGLPVSENQTSLGGESVSCPLNWLVPYGLIVSVLLQSGWTTRFEDEYLSVTRSPDCCVFAPKFGVNLNESELNGGRSSFNSWSTAIAKSSCETSPILCPLNESTRIPFLNRSKLVA